jgi:anti-sigma regulatory factor (Ser/Thr protein kinase)
VDEGEALSAVELARGCDWAATPLGSREVWPPVVEHLVSTLLEAPVPLCYQHGPSLAMVYNDAFAELLGRKHPDAFSAPTREVVAEVWDRPNVGPAFLRVIEKGEGFLEDGVQLGLRRGRDLAREVDTGYYLRAGSPVRDSDGTVLGVLHVVLETTAGVERIHSVADLASALAVAVSVDDVCKVALLHALQALPAEEAMVCLPPGGVGSWRVTRRRADEQFSGAEERLPLVWTDLLGAEVELIEELLASGRVAGGQGLLVLPMAIDGREGAIVLRLGTASVGAETEMVLASAATLVGQALARAQIFDRERSNAETLQRAMLPQVLPQPASFTLAGQYEPVATGAVVGGDFYDAFFLQDGRLALLIGDVMGRGVAAATVMGQIRAAARGAALSSPEPASVMAALDVLVEGLDETWPASVALGAAPDQAGGFLASGFGGELFVTMLYGLLDPATGEVVLASAGHCPPAVVPRRPGSGGADDGVGGADDGVGGADDGADVSEGRARLVDLTIGPPLGLGGARLAHALRLGDGELLLAYTDGLLERRTRPMARGEERLLSVLDGLEHTSAHRACELVLEEMGRGEGFEDDCAVLAVGRTSWEHRSVTLVVPPVPEAVRPARAWARQHLEEWQVGAGAQFAVVTGLSELVTNAVLHAGTEARVTLELNGARLTVTVSDTGRRGAPRASLDIADAATRGRGLSLVRTVSDAFGSHPSANGSTVWFEVAVGDPQR